MRIEAKRYRKIKGKDLLKDYFTGGWFDLIQGYRDAGRIYFVWDESGTCTIYKEKRNKTKVVRLFQISKEAFKQLIFEEEQYNDAVFKYRFVESTYTEGND